MKYLKASSFGESGPQGLSIESQQQFQTSLATVILRNQIPVQIQRRHKSILQSVAPVERMGRLCFPAFQHTPVSPSCLRTAGTVTAQSCPNLYSSAFPSAVYYTAFSFLSAAGPPLLVLHTRDLPPPHMLPWDLKPCSSFTPTKVSTDPSCIAAGGSS